MMKATDSDEVFIGVEPILKRMDVHFNCNEIFFKDLENLMEELSFAVCLAPENMAKNKLRWPFHDENTRENFIKYILRNRPEFRQWLEAYDKKCGLKAHEKLLEIVEKALKHAEILLSEENRVGIWIGGIEFSLLDCRFTSLLVGLYQLGLEEMWSEGEKPNLSMYIQQAFNRDSVLRYTKWKENQSKVFHLDQEDEQVKSARYAYYLALGLAGIYVIKKALKWW